MSSRIMTNMGHTILSEIIINILKTSKKLAEISITKKCKAFVDGKR